jgi:prepilin-type N-terminal cleavage/methylation domain-containing protein
MGFNDLGGGCDGLQRRPARVRAGFSIIEVVVTLSILVVAGSLFCQMLLSGRRVRQVNRESTLAADAARVVLERMRNESFLYVYRDYNEDPSDDPLGNGTGPGATFDVEGLEPLGDTEHPTVGTITFPTVTVQVGGGGGKLGGKSGGVSGGTVGTVHWYLREDSENELLGMPRDLNGDNKIDTVNHSTDYLILPVCVRLEWKSTTGTRKFELVTQLADVPLAEEP